MGPSPQDHHTVTFKLSGHPGFPPTSTASRPVVAACCAHGGLGVSRAGCSVAEVCLYRPGTRTEGNRDAIKAEPQDGAGLGATAAAGIVVNSTAVTSADETEPG